MRSRRVILAAWVAIPLIAPPALAFDEPDAIGDPSTSDPPRPAVASSPQTGLTAIRAEDGATLTLSDGRTLRLAGIEAPPLPAGGARRSSSADAARAGLWALVDGRHLTLADEAPDVDRHGRIKAHAITETGEWIEGELLRRGLARVRTTPTDRTRASAMLALEAQSRRDGLGVWKDAAWSVRSAEPAALRHDRGSFQIIEGRVRRAEKHGGEVYLDFGDDWRRDVSASIDAAAMRLFKKAGLDPLTLDGKPVRLRGWVVEHNGPMVLLTHPEQVETELAPPPSPPP